MVENPGNKSTTTVQTLTSPADIAGQDKGQTGSVTKETQTGQSKPEGDELISLTIDGKEQWFTKEQIAKGMMMQSDYSKKTDAVAKERKKLEQERAEFEEGKGTNEEDEEDEKTTSKTTEFGKDIKDIEDDVSANLNAQFNSAMALKISLGTKLTEEEVEGARKIWLNNEHLTPSQALNVFSNIKAQKDQSIQQQKTSLGQSQKTETQTQPPITFQDLKTSEEKQKYIKEKYPKLPGQ